MLTQNDIIPLYQQLKKEIKDSILKGELKPGDKIYTEVELSEKYDVSRITVRSAISELVDEGLLIKKQGKGTFVSNIKINREFAKFAGFTESCRLLGLTPSSKVTKVKILKPSSHQISSLEIDENDKLIFIQRIRFADGEPVMVESNFFSYNKYSFLLKEEHLENSLYELLYKKYSIKVCKSVSSVEIARAQEHEAEYLNVSKGYPLLFLKGVTYDDKDRPVHITNEYIDTDKYKFSFTNSI